MKDLLDSRWSPVPLAQHHSVNLFVQWRRDCNGWILPNIFGAPFESGAPRQRVRPQILQTLRGLFGRGEIKMSMPPYSASLICYDTADPSMRAKSMRDVSQSPKIAFRRLRQMHRTPNDMLRKDQGILRSCLKAGLPQVDEGERLHSQMRQDITSTAAVGISCGLHRFLCREAMAEHWRNLTRHDNAKGRLRSLPAAAPRDSSGGHTRPRDIGWTGRFAPPSCAAECLEIYPCAVPCDDSS